MKSGLLAGICIFLGLHFLIVVLILGIGATDRDSGGFILYNAVLYAIMPIGIVWSNGITYLGEVNFVVLNGLFLLAIVLLLKKFICVILRHKERGLKD